MPKPEASLDSLEGQLKDISIQLQVIDSLMRGVNENAARSESNTLRIIENRDAVEKLSEAIVGDRTRGIDGVISRLGQMDLRIEELINMSRRNYDVDEVLEKVQEMWSLYSMLKWAGLTTPRGIFGWLIVLTAAGLFGLQQMGLLEWLTAAPIP